MFAPSPFSRVAVILILTASLFPLSGCGQANLSNGGGDGGSSPSDVTDETPKDQKASNQDGDRTEDAENDTSLPPVACSTTEDCPQETPCASWSCGDEGICVMEARVGEACDDDDACTTGEACTADGICAGGEPAELVDSPCEDCSCDPEVGLICKPAALGASCNDGDCCTQGDHCAACDPINDEGCSQSGRICTPETLFCDDENPCTADVCSCDENHIPSCQTQKAADGIVCDYNPNDCTTGDHCDDGICVIGVPKDLDDLNPCTQDICVKGEVVHNAVLDGPCNDGNICTTQDHCYLGTCVGGESLACTIPVCGSSAYCVKEEGCVVEWMPEGAVCDDQNTCTTNDQCGADHSCSGDASGCDDFNPCTTDICEPNVGCSNKADPIMDGMSCNLDTSVCGSDGVCKEGICVAEESDSCDDANPCTKDSCDPATGCISDPDSTMNGTACSLGETLCGNDGVCNEGTCEPNNTAICDDQNPCTVDSCDLVEGCKNVEDSSTDGISCVAVETNCGAPGHCSNGICVASLGFDGTEWSAGEGDCDDQNPCTEDSCGDNNECQHIPQDVDCDDGDPCTDGDTCKEGVCMGDFNGEASQSVNCTQINDIDVAETPGATKNQCCCHKKDPTGKYKSAHVLDMGEKEPGSSIECCLTPGFTQGCSDTAYFDVSLDGITWTPMDSFPTSSTQKPGGGWEPFCTTITPGETYRYVRGGNDKCYVDHLVCSVQCGGDEPPEDTTDSATKVPASGDTWLENSGNQGSHKYLIVGLHGTWPKKRALLKFDTSELNGDKTIASATLRVYYRYAHSASWLSEEPIDRVIAVHQVLTEWSEGAASEFKATATSSWQEPLCGINDVDAASVAVDSQLWVALETKEWKSFDITSLVQKWVDDPSTNHGVLLRAENEDVPGRDMRIYSRNASETDDAGNNLHPYLEVTYDP